MAPLRIEHIKIAPIYNHRSLKVVYLNRIHSSLITTVHGGLVKTQGECGFLSVLGSQFGDEGKGKMTDALLATNKFEICARAQGGHNAGHSVKTGDKSYSLHLLP